jgi:uncharacterized protein
VGGPKTPEVLDAALRYGFTHWDTASSYGESEGVIGKYLQTHKGLRKKLFLSTKPPDIATPLPVIPDVWKHLENSLRVMNTDCIDLYLGVHAMVKPDQLTDDLRKFAEEAKKKGMIRFFGFSNHANMTQNLAAASKLDWIDAILVNYSYRMVSNKGINESIDACVKANIGLVAIKVLGFGAKDMSEAEKKLTDQFTARGLDLIQGKIKVVLEDRRFTSASMGMKGSVEYVRSCGGAAIDAKPLSAVDRAALDEFARATRSGFCAGCTHVCGSELPAGLPLVHDVMRYLMYHDNYGDHDLARELFARIPEDARQRFLAADYGQAEARCPQRMAIGSLIAEACRKLA